MSKFKKLLFTLLFILVVEILLIIIEVQISKTTSSIKNYDNKKPIVILVDVESNILSVSQDGRILKSYTIASGRPSTPSPLGIWKITNKDTWGAGFGGRWMGFNVPWGDYGIHGTIFPGSIGNSASHGCIRMNNKDVAELYSITKYGTTVIVYGGVYGNFGSYLRTVKPGMRGSDIYELQRIMKVKGYYNGNPDGIYGEGMRYFVHEFQKNNKLPVSDVIGNSFYKKLGVELVE